MFKKILILNVTLVIGAILLTNGVEGKTARIIAKRAAPQPRRSSNISETSQQTGSVSGFVNTTAQGNGEVGSAQAYSWQGGQTSAQGTQTATADQNSNLNSQTSGSSNCQQGYLGTGSGENVNSVGNALCNATNTQTGTHEINERNKGESDTKFGWYPSLPFPGPYQHPAPIQMNYTVGMFGEGIAGQTHNSQSSVGGETGPGVMNIFAGGFAGAPQGSTTFSHSAIDPFGNVLNANQSLETGPIVGSEEHSIVSLSGNSIGHNNDGLSHATAIGSATNSSYNSHAPETDEEKKKSGVVGITLNY